MARSYATDDEPFTITIEPGSYSMTKSLFLYSNTTLIADGCTFTMHSDEDYHMFQSGRPSSESYVGYDAFKNITVKGGVWDTNGLESTTALGNEGRINAQLAHVTNLTIEGVTFSGTIDNHTMELAACENVLIKDCVFNPVTVKYKNTSAKEALQIDVCNDSFGVYYTAGQPILSVHNMEVTGSTFNGQVCGVGSHKTNASDPFMNIKIHDNVFNNINISKVSGASLDQANVAINVQNMKNSQIYNNTITTCGSTGIRVADDCSGTTVTNNTISSVGEKGIQILNNATVEDVSSNTVDTVKNGPGIIVYGSIVGNISNNVIKNVKTVGIFLLNQTFNGTNNKSKVTTISGNNISSAKKHGITVENSKAENITGNTVTGAGINGIFLQKKGSVTHIDSNVITNPKKNGISLYQNCKAGSIDSNVIKNAKNQGITLEKSTASSIKNNTITNSKVNGIFLQKSSSGGKIDNNNIKGSQKNGIMLYNKCKATSISGNKVDKSKKNAICVYIGSTVSHIEKNTVNNANFTFAQQKYVEFMLQADNTASNPTLNLNNTGARPIGYSYASTWNAMPYRVSGTELVAGSYIMQCIIGGRWSTQQWYIIRTAPYRFYLNRLKMDLGLS